MMLRGLGATEGTVNACSLGTDAEAGFTVGLEQWIPSSENSAATGISYITNAGNMLAGLFNPSLWACQPMTQIGMLLPPLAIVVGALTLLKSRRR